MSAPAMARLLAIMGSGETAPTMVKVHRNLIERIGGGPSVLLDTPYGFQENADDISAKAVDYFAQSVGAPITVASFRSADVDAITQDRAAAAVRAARYVFAGPGSPTYALRQWAGTAMPGLVADRFVVGGAVTFASAAALTLGVVTVPVYEVYKAGEEPRWRPGLDLLAAATGLSAAVIPHFDNAEGGHHDTRFCYLGERRLALLEQSLPAGAFVLGVDEHTAAVIDLDAATLTVAGIGVVTVRVAGANVAIWKTGSMVSLDELRAVVAGDRLGGSITGSTISPLVESGSGSSASSGSADDEQATIAGGVGARSPLLADADRLATVFDAAVLRRDVPAAVNAILELDRTLVAWAADTLQSDELDQARAVLRSMVVRLGELAETGARDPREVVGPFVDALVSLRQSARAAKDFATSDAIRDALTGAGIELRDTPTGPEWVLDAGS